MKVEETMEMVDRMNSYLSPTKIKTLLSKQKNIFLLLAAILFQLIRIHKM